MNPDDALENTLTTIYYRLLEAEFFSKEGVGQRTFPTGTVIFTTGGVMRVLHDPEWIRWVLFAQAEKISALEVLASA